MTPLFVSKLVKENRSSQECSICYRKQHENDGHLDDYDNYTIVFLSPCRHSFCYECLEKYDDARKRFEAQPCPICREDLSPMVLWLVYDEMRFINKLLNLLRQPVDACDIKEMRILGEWFKVKNFKKSKRKTLYMTLSRLLC